jgi:hypothetical protein
MDERIRRRLVTELSRLPKRDFEAIAGEVENRENAEQAGAAFLGELLAAKQRPLAGLFAGEEED